MPRFERGEAPEGGRIVGSHAQSVDRFRGEPDDLPLAQGLDGGQGLRFGDLGSGRGGGIG